MRALRIPDSLVMVGTPMIANPAVYQVFTGVEGADRAVAEQNMVALNTLKIRG
jgi:hypothetical protein